MADLLSRRDPVSTEWSLNSRSFSQILDLIPKPEVNLFATRWNTPIVCSSNVRSASSIQRCRPDRLEQMEDDLHLSSDSIDFEGCLLKLTEFQGTAYVVAPFWPNSHWFGQLLQSSRSYRPLRSAQLSQVVRGEACYAPSFLSQDLHVWIF